MLKKNCSFKRAFPVMGAKRLLYLQPRPASRPIISVHSHRLGVSSAVLGEWGPESIRDDSHAVLWIFIYPAGTRTKPVIVPSLAAANRCAQTVMMSSYGAAHYTIPKRRVRGASLKGAHRRKCSCRSLDPESHAWWRSRAINVKRRWS